MYLVCELINKLACYSCCLGKPVDCKEDVDYVPTVFIFKRMSEQSKSQKVARKKRYNKRGLKTSTCSSTNNQEHDSQTDLLVTEEIEGRENNSESSQKSVALQTDINHHCDVATQTPPLFLAPHLSHMPVSNILIENDDATKFYTGLSSWSLFQYLLSQLIQYYPCDTVFRNTKLSPVNGLLMVLMRLRLNLRVEDLSYRFKISLSSVYDHFTTWIEVMYVHLRSLIKWPTKVTICANMPQIFKDLYPHARCIIDCSEIFIQRPYGYQARAQSYSNYKKHNTAKFLIAITPCGAISFVSNLLEENVKHCFCFFKMLWIIQNSFNVQTS